MAGRGKGNPGIRLPGARPTADLPLILGIASSGCGLAGLAAWTGYARNAGASIRAVISRAPAEAHRLAVLAEWCSLAQMLLGLSAVGLAWYVRTRRGVSSLAKWVSGVGLVLGIVVLMLRLLMV
jgi:hypothetical protein